MIQLSTEFYLERSVNKAHSQILSSPELVSHAERQLKEAIHEVLYKFVRNEEMMEVFAL